MSDEWTPTTKQVRQGYIWDYCPENTEERKILFDRWLAKRDAKRDAKVRTAALEEAVEIAERYLCDLDGCGNIRCIHARKIVAAIRAAEVADS